MDKLKRHAEICNELNETYRRKNADYGDSFRRSYERLGIISAVTRIGDKYNRLENLATKGKQNGEVKDESILDTLKDLANYAIMTVIEIENAKNIKIANKKLDAIGEN